MKKIENLKVWIANLGKYNEGDLIGKWLSLPVSDDELKKSFVEIGIAHFDKNGEYHPYVEENGVFYEEYGIFDYDLCPFEFGEYEKLEDINLLARKLSVMSIDEQTKVLAYIDFHGGYSTPMDILKVCVQSDGIPFSTYWYEGMNNKDEWGVTVAEQCSNVENYGRTIAHTRGITSYLEKMGVEYCFDFEKYGAADSQSGYVELFDNGYLDANVTLDLELYSYEDIKKIVNEEYKLKSSLSYKMGVAESFGNKMNDSYDTEILTSLSNKQVKEECK